MKKYHNKTAGPSEFRNISAGKGSSSSSETSGEKRKRIRSGKAPQENFTKNEIWNLSSSETVSSEEETEMVNTNLLKHVKDLVVIVRKQTCLIEDLKVAVELCIDLVDENQHAVKNAITDLKQDMKVFNGGKDNTGDI